MNTLYNNSSSLYIYSGTLTATSLRTYQAVLIRNLGLLGFLAEEGGHRLATEGHG